MTDDRLKMYFGFALLAIVGLLCLVIGLGKVTQENSYGLDSMMGCLTTLAGGFSVWCFTKGKDNDNSKTGQ